MNWINIAKVVLIGIASAAYVNIHYDDRKYKPFGFRYWLSLFSLIFVGVAHLDCHNVGNHLTYDNKILYTFTGNLAPFSILSNRKYNIASRFYESVDCTH